MKRIYMSLLALIILFIMILIPWNGVVVGAESLVMGDIERLTCFQYKIEDYKGEKAAIITGCTIGKEDAWNDTYIEIPKELGGYPVRVINEHAFKDCSTPWFFVLPEGVKEIREGAFEGCTELLSVLIGRTVTFIDETAFNGCSPGFEIWTYEGSYAHSFAENYGIPYRIEEYITYKDEETGLLVQIKNTMLSDKNVEVKLDIITEGEEFVNLTKGIARDAVLYNVSFMVDGKEIQPEGDTAIYLPIPYSICGYYSTAYVVEEDDVLTEAGDIGGYGIGYQYWQVARFNNTSFGRFMVVGPHMFGDVDDNCEITANDALVLLKSVVGLEQLTEGQEETADVDCDGDVTAVDALYILKKIVKLRELPVITKIPL